MKKWFLISFILIALGLLAGVGWNAYTDEVKKDISKTQDTTMNAYRDAKELVSFYPKYLAISSDNTYQDLKTTMKGRMTDSLYEELFYFEEYPIVNKGVMVTVNSIRGHKVSQRNFEFKLDINYATNGTLYNFIYVAGVDNGTIMYVTRIK